MRLTTCFVICNELVLNFHKEIFDSLSVCVNKAQRLGSCALQGMTPKASHF
ncbi:hypothetical protein Plhal304r1_c062g0149621 [Plasmopara halstedii]